MKDYEKKYKEALERAKKYKLKEDLIITQDLFPELKVSDDERIRKALIKFFTLSDDNADYQCCGVHYKDIVAWLEKQEQKPADKVEPKFKVGQTIIYKGTENIAPTKMTISDIAKGQYWDDNCCIVPISDQDNWELVEQKPTTWSEEDKRKIDRIYSILRQASDTHAFSTSCRLIGDKECIELQDFLKSLRPQSQWKPSDEQIIALRWVLNNIPYNIHKEEISGLLDQIKDL